MTTLAERLRELEVIDAENMRSHAKSKSVINNCYPHTVQHHATAIAQELHALLVECGEITRFYANEGYDGYDITVTNYGLSTEEGDIIKDAGGKARELLTKLKQAGIV